MPKSALVFVKLKLVSSDNSIPIEVMPFSQLQVIIIDYALIKAFSGNSSRKPIGMCSHLCTLMKQEAIGDHKTIP
uniref:Uncharacterized protein n=1 Tax=Anguilla anguilla TaxID=7936 RepID=A0A0E9RUP4_ANGAN